MTRAATRAVTRAATRAAPNLPLSDLSLAIFEAANRVLLPRSYFLQRQRLWHTAWHACSFDLGVPALAGERVSVVCVEFEESNDDARERGKALESLNSIVRQREVDDIDESSLCVPTDIDYRQLRFVTIRFHIDHEAYVPWHPTPTVPPHNRRPIILLRYRDHDSRRVPAFAIYGPHHSLSKPWLVNFRVLLFSVTARTTWSDAPSGISASISSVTMTSAPSCADR